MANEDPLLVHGYMSNAGYEEVREAIAQSLNRRFGTHFTGAEILMTVGAAGGLNVILKTLLNPGDEVLTFAPFFSEYRNYVGQLRRRAARCLAGHHNLPTESVGGLPPNSPPRQRP